ncbi:MAG: HAD family hydrolase [Candidatus Binatia bacterium]
MISSIIFDLDGLLADTEPLHCRAYQEALRCRGVTLTDAEYADHWVRTGRGIAEWLVSHRLELDPIALRAYKSQCYLGLLVTDLRPMDGALQLLESLRGKKSLALASSSYRDAVDGVLKELNIAHYFQAIVSGLDVAEVKPAPDIFLEAARRIGTPPTECLVLEDAEKGVIAAYRAGMRCIAVPNEHTRHHDFSKALKVCSSLTEVTLELIESMG